MSHIYQKCGALNHTRFIDIGKVSKALGSSICSAVVGLHALTGCDTVSAFAGNGKLSAFKQMKANSTYQEAFSKLVSPGMYQQTYFRKYKKSLATCTSLLHRHQVSMNYDIYSELNKEKWSLLASFHHVKTAFLCMSFMPTTRLPFGDAAWKVNPLYKVPSYGWMTDDSGNLAIEWRHGTSTRITTTHLQVYTIMQITRVHMPC